MNDDMPGRIWAHISNPNAPKEGVWWEDERSWAMPCIPETIHDAALAEAQRRALLDAADIADETYQRARRNFPEVPSAGACDWAEVGAWLRTIAYANAEEDEPDGEGKQGGDAGSAGEGSGQAYPSRG